MDEGKETTAIIPYVPEAVNPSNQLLCRLRYGFNH